MRTHCKDNKLFRKCVLLVLMTVTSTQIFGQIYLSDNGLTASGSGTTRRVQFGGTLIQNTNIDLGSTFNLGFQKGTSRYLDILNNGNIGIGTNSPSARFDVNGTSRFRGALTMNYGTTNRSIQLTDAGILFSRLSDGTMASSITADGNMSINSRNNIRFLSNAIERMTLFESGNVGIGVTNPSAFRLDVAGTTRSTILRSSNSSFSGHIELEQVNNNQSRIYGGPQESIVFGPDNGIRVNTNVFGVQAGTMSIGGNILLNPGSTVTAAMQPAVPGNSILKVVGNYTNSGASGVWEGNSYVGAVDVATAIAPTTVTLNQFSVLNNINTTSGTTIHRGFYYNPVLNGTTGLTNIAFEATSGQVKIGGLSGTGTRMVVADANGVLGVQSIPSGGGGGIWNLSGTSVTNTNSGNIGIGTLNPLKKLHVAGSALIEQAVGDGFSVIHTKGMLNWDRGTEFRFSDADGLSNSYSLKITGYNDANKIISVGLEGSSQGIFGGSCWSFQDMLTLNNGIANNYHTDFDIRLRYNSMFPENKAIKFYADNYSSSPIMSIVQDGTVGIGTVDTKGYKFAVAGNTVTEKLVVKQVNAWPDYVFEQSYKLPSLAFVENYIREHKHLPGMVSAAEVEEHGVDIGETQAQLLKKIEELTLYVIELRKEVDELKGNRNQDRRVKNR